MKFVSYTEGAARRFGAIRKDAIVDLGDLGVPDLKGLLAAGEPAMNAAAKLAAEGANVVPFKGAKLLPPIPNPGTIWCAGMNTHSHYEEVKDLLKLTSEPPKPILFIRNTNTLVASGQDLEKPKLEKNFDYEGEIALVIGKRGRAIAAADAMDYIAGYSCFNDASGRDYQRSSSQFTAGKNGYHSGGFGPVLVTRDEVDEKSLVMSCRVNGVELQRMAISDLIFGFGQLISFISEFTWLEPGDVIVTGSPAGVGFMRKPPALLKAGDTIEVEVTGVGVLVNGVRDQAS